MSKRRLQALPASTSSETLTTHGWDWATAALWGDNASDKTKCSVRMTDTVIFYRDGGGGTIDTCLWLFTGKNGTVTRKRAPQNGTVPVNKIRERFLQLTSNSDVGKAGASQGEAYIAVVVFQDGTRQLVGLAEFDEYLQALDEEKRGQGVSSSLLNRKRVVKGFQAYVPSHGDGPSHIYVTFQASSGGATLPHVSIERQEGFLHTKSDIPRPGDPRTLDLSSSHRKEVESATASVVNFLARAGNAQLVTAALEFVLDGTQTLWLTHIEHVEFQQYDERTAVAPSLLSQKQASLPDILSAAKIGGDGSAKKCRGEFCQSSLSLLPGLSRMLKTLRSKGMMNEPRNQSNNGDEMDERQDAVLEDTGQRYKMGNNNLLLAHAEIEFLRGTAARVHQQLDANALALQWQEADNVFRMELGRSNPTQFYKQVMVCANCHRLYSEINKARDMGFQRPRSAQMKIDIDGTSNITVSRNAKKDQSGTVTNSNVNEAPHPGGDGDAVGDDSSDIYDKMFLDELAKHSGDTEERVEGSPGSFPSSSRRSTPRGPEQDENVERLSSGSRSARDRSVLPSLQTTTLRDVKSKAKGGSAGREGLPHEASNAVNNQQSLANLPIQGRSDKEHLPAKVASLEAELSQVRRSLSVVEAGKKKLEQEILQTRAQCTAKLHEKDDQARKQLLELEFSFHSKESKAKLQQGGSNSNSSDEMAGLIETIDSLSLQLDQANSEKEQAKKLVAQAHQAELKRLHEKYQLDMETLRLSEHTAKEQTENLQMHVLSLQSQTQMANAQAKNAKAALDDLTKNKLGALEEKNQRLERQIGALKTQQRNLGQASGGPVNLTASALEQDMEAMEKHLNNKVDYLKAQLASEMKCKDELGSHLAQITNAMEQMKKEKRQALTEQEEAFKRQAERMESGFSQEKEVFVTQQATLQGKLVTLQANVTDLVQELTMWKSKEANAKLAMEKMVEENVRLTRQLVDAEGQVEALQEERKHDATKAGSMSVKNASEETNRVQMEALMRRLDNERQYLKSQLEGQQEMKEKSQTQVTDLQHEMRELKDAMEEALRTGEQKLSALTTEKRNHELELRGTIECLEEGKLLLSRQLKEVQTKFTQAREQALLERDEIEKARIEMSEMRAQLLSAKEDSVKEQAYARTAGERMSKSLAVVKKSLKAMEEEKNLQIQHLEEENAMYMGKLAATQGDMLVLEERRTTDAACAKKESATKMLAMVLCEKVALWRLKSQHRAFMHVRMHASLSGVRTAMSKQRSDELGALEERLREDYMAKCDEMTQTLHDERLQAIRGMKETHDKDREELHEFYKQEKSQLQEELMAMHSAQLQEREQQFSSLSQSIEANAANAIQTLQRQCDELLESNHDLTGELAGATQKCETITCAFEDEVSALRAEWESKQENWHIQQAELQEQLGAQRDGFEAQLTAETTELVERHAQQLSQMQERHEVESGALVSQLNAQMTMCSEEQTQRYADIYASKVTTMTLEHQSELEKAVLNATEHWQQEINRLHEAHEATLEVRLNEAEQTAQTQLNALQQEMTERKGSAVVQCTSKWQRAMEELQERLESEKRVAYNEGLQDREKEWQQAAQQIKGKQREELHAVQNEAVGAIRAAEERHEMRFQAQLAQLKTQLEEQHAEAIRALTDEITERERERAQEQCDVSAEVLEQELTLKWTQELEKQKARLEVEFNDEQARLSTTLTKEKEAVVKQHREWHEEELVQLENEWVEKLEALTAAKTSAHDGELRSLREEFSREMETSRQQLEDTFAQQLDTQLREQETKLLREQEDAIAQVQEDSEKLIEQVELAMAELKRQKEHLEAELLGLRSALEEAEDAQFDAQESFKKQQKQATFRLLELVARAQKKLSDEARATTSMRMELEGKHRRLEDQWMEEKAQCEQLMTRVQDTWNQVQTQHSEMTQTLTNYKRDELVAHRSASAVLSNEISIVSKQLEEVDEMKATLEREIAALQTEAQSVEAALRDLMLQSSGSSGGALNMAVVAKKRRLNEEFEALLERIEKKKAEVRTVDQTLGSLRARREDKEHEMRVMERKLVEILVQQQKQMLLLVTAVRDISLPVAAASAS
ncbi:hypothetical protein BBJ28_00003022 [Nothophytophthora sp. Chile5]|nr:hypothetical protein BBJ28_00003022 [Nothophytophthora sp. Chile5]